MTETEERTALLLVAVAITYNLAREYDQTVALFDELLGGIAREIPKEQRKPAQVPYMSWDEQERVIRWEWVRGLDHIILAVHPHENILLLDIIWHTSFDSAFVHGAIEDFYHPQMSTLHSFPLQADIRVRTREQEKSPV